MKHCWPLVVIVMASLSLTGCKLESESKVKYSQLMAPLSTIESILKIEVAACKDHEDASKPSNSLKETNDKIAELFPEAEFLECKNIDFDSFALYTIPMTVGVSDSSKLSKGDIGIITDKKGGAFFALSERLSDFIKKQEDLKLSATVRITNDTDKTLKIYPISCYVNGFPFAGTPEWELNTDIPVKKSATIRISDVSADFAIGAGIVPLYYIK